MPCSTIPEPTMNGATKGVVPEGWDPVPGHIATLGRACKGSVGSVGLLQTRLEGR